MYSHSIFRRWRAILWRLHRRVGISALVFLALMAITGIALNHADGWKLYDTRLPYNLAVGLYGDMGAEQLVSVTTQGVQIYQIGTDLVFDRKLLSERCGGHLNGMAYVDGLFWVGCGQKLLVVTKSGEPVEKISPGALLTGVANCSEKLCLMTESGWVELDLISLETIPTDATPKLVSPEAPNLDQLPDYLKITPEELNVGRLIADIHSGALFKAPGKLAVDLLGLVVLFLAVSGCYLWLGNRRK